jgi:hypothetical protein
MTDDPANFYARLQSSIDADTRRERRPPMNVKHTPTNSEALPPTTGSAWDLPLHHPKSPFQSKSVVNWVFSHKCEGCDTLIKLYQTHCGNCKQNREL